MKHVSILLTTLLLPVCAAAQVRITEWQYSGDEFVEFTNVGSTPVDMTGWSYDDDSRLAGTVDLSAYGMVAPGASVILCESSAALFAANWSLTGVTILGGNTSNLGRNDEINLYDAGGNLVDRFAYGDQNFPGTLRAQNVSGSPCNAALGQNDAYAWTAAYVGDARGSYASLNGEVANPGTYAAIDAPLTTYGAGCAGTGGVIPSLSARGCGILGGLVQVTVDQAQPMTAGALVFGLGRAQISLGNCDLLIAVVAADVPFATDANGAYVANLAVPTGIAAGLLGCQAAVADAGAAGGFTTTNGLEITLR